jgi:hypothetical protein
MSRWFISRLCIVISVGLFKLGEPRERRYYDIDFIKEAEQQVCKIKQNIEAAQARQKSYADKRRKPIEFEVGDHVYLRVSLMKGVQMFRVKCKLAP